MKKTAENKALLMRKQRTVAHTLSGGDNKMRKILITGLIVFAMLSVSGSVIATSTSWDINTSTKDMVDNFSGYFNSGTMQYGVNTTGVDGWYGHEVAKISKTADWSGRGFALSLTNYKCPKVASDAKYGKATILNVVDTDNRNGVSGLFNVNVGSNYKEANNGGGAYPVGNFDWASYGTHLEAEGDYAMESGISETTKANANNHFDYVMSGLGSGTIRYGASNFNSGTNWGDKRGSVSLGRWEYNGANATGSGLFTENLGGDNYLQNFKFTLPNGGDIYTAVNFNDGMDSTPIWMYGN